MNKKILLVPALVVTVVGASLWASTQTFAQTPTSDPHAALVQKLADKFNLNKDEVQKVFDEQRVEHKVIMKQKMEDKLSQLVKDGKITEEQKTKLQNKLNEMHANREAEMEEMKSMTPEQRKEAMKAHKEELKKWAQENDIDLNVFMEEHEGKIKMGWR